MSDYFNVTTNVGDAAIANAIANNSKLNITHIAFGDGNGSVPTPTKTRTTLIKEVHRQTVTKYAMHPTIANYIVIETIIPSNIGGFWIREMGVIADNVLMSHGSHAPFFKVADPEGVSEYRLKFTQNVRDGSVVEILLDESLIYASQEWVDENYIRRNEIIDNLTTDDATKPVSAKQAKKLQDEKFPTTGGEVNGGVFAVNLGASGMADYTPTSQGAYLSWNRTNGQGKTDFINHKGRGDGGFDWWNSNTDDDYTCVMTLNSDGSLNVSGGLNSNAATATKLKNAQTINDVEFDGSKPINIADNTKIKLGQFGLGMKNGDTLNSLTLSDLNDPASWYSGFGRFVDAGIPGEYGNIIRMGNGAQNTQEGWYSDLAIATNGKLSLRYRTNTGNWSGFTEIVKQGDALTGSLVGNATTATKLQVARTISFSGAATGSANYDGSGNSSCILTLANSGVVASTYGSSLKIPVITVNQKGLITGVSEQQIPIVDDLTTGGSAKLLSAEQGKVLNDQSFGVGQSLQDMTSQRTKGSTYTNTTGKPIFIAISWAQSGSRFLQLFIDDDEVASYRQDGATGGGLISMLVQNGSTYRISGDNPIARWREFR